MSVLISIIMPFYNNEKYIIETLNSITQQDFLNYEFIIINDGSTDNSLDIVKYYANIDSRIKIYNKPHSNAGDSRNLGLKFACGEYICFIDSDDIFKNNMLSTMYSKAVFTNSDVVICSYVRFDNNTGRYLRKYVPSSNYLIKSRYYSNDVVNDLFTLVSPEPWGKLIRRKIIVDNSIKFQSISSCNDVAFTYSVLSQAKIIAFCSETLIYYRTSIKNNITANRGKVAENIVYALEELQNRLKKYDKFNLLKQTFINLSKKCLINELKLCDKTKKEQVLNLVSVKLGTEILLSIKE